MGNTLFNIALLLIATKIGGVISRRLKMPEVLGALLAGVVLGPMLLNLVPYDDSIQLLANLGVILLMFLAGLETDAGQFPKAGKSAFVIAVMGIMLSHYYAGILHSHNTGRLPYDNCNAGPAQAVVFT